MNKSLRTQDFHQCILDQLYCPMLVILSAAVSVTVTGCPMLVLRMLARHHKMAVIQFRSSDYKLERKSLVATPKRGHTGKHANTNKHYSSWKKCCMQKCSSSMPSGKYCHVAVGLYILREWPSWSKCYMILSLLWSRKEFEEQKWIRIRTFLANDGRFYTQQFIRVQGLNVFLDFIFSLSFKHTLWLLYILSRFTGGGQQEAVPVSSDYICASPIFLFWTDNIITWHWQNIIRLYRLCCCCARSFPDRIMRSHLWQSLFLIPDSFPPNKLPENCSGDGLHAVRYTLRCILAIKYYGFQ